ncbi:5-formyltetrahydrofolate cyclo-ligase [Kocuria tytonicola]|uniref:5-formyltetrahydrofolate cyclo-ligase n=1 Tax=Kocuria tytonicola TaxID=2055946 RepID=UPI001F0B93ED|nr:5-formyltetrahydrofolate cyclo-ligase [Kocuria tytonicola]
MTNGPADADAKARLRGEVLERRRRRAGAARRGAEAGFSRHLARVLAETNAPDVAAFLPLPGEPPLLPALAQAHERGHRVWLPAVEPGRRLSWVRWQPGTPLAPGALPGLLEPTGQRHGTEAFTAVGLLVVPVVAVGRDGVRLGFGGGYYDRFLPVLSAAGHRPRIMACCFADEVMPAGSVPRESHDAVLDTVLTEHGVVVLREPAGDRSPAPATTGRGATPCGGSETLPPE